MHHRVVALTCGPYAEFCTAILDIAFDISLNFISKEQNHRSVSQAITDGDPFIHRPTLLGDHQNSASGLPWKPSG